MVLLALVLVAVVYYMAGPRYEKAAEINRTARNMEPASQVEEEFIEQLDEIVQSEDEEGSIEEINVFGSNFAFQPAEITVGQGDRVRIIFESVEGYHDWVLDEFDARTDRVNEGDAATAEFTAETAGTYEYYCSVDNHRALGMVGSLTVE